MQNTVDALELDRSISQLSYVEKRLVMVISLTNQLKQSQGDYARTIESTANQFRILGEQWSRLTRSVGNVFYNLLGSILPYLNGILMALTEIFNLIASLLGFEMPEFDYSNLTGISEGALQLEEDLNGAGESADNLKQKLSGLRGFDKLNVISTPKSSGSAGGTGGAGGTIDPKILNTFNDAFGKYDDLMGSVRMKALDIRDAIMEWLGFTKEVNPITGEVSWKYQGIQKTLENIWNSIVNAFKEANPLVQAFVEMLGVLAVGKIATGIYNVVKNLEKTITPLNKITGVMYGAMGIIAGIGLIRDGMSKVNDESTKAIGTLETLGGVYSSIIGGGVAGAAIGGVKGAAVGGVLGGITGIITTIQSYNNEWDNIVDNVLSKNQILLVNLDKIKEKHGEIGKTLDSIETYTEKYKSMADDLTKFADENGKVKSGYEGTVKYIAGELSKAYGIEIQIVDGVIQNYQELKTSIYDVIEAKKQQLKMEQYDKINQQATEDQTELEKGLFDAKKQTLNATLTYNQELERLAIQIGTNKETYQAYMDAIKRGEKDNYEQYNLTMWQASAIYDQTEKMKQQKGTLYKLQQGINSAKESEQKYTDQLDKNAKMQTLYSLATQKMLEGDYDTANDLYQKLEILNDEYTNGYTDTLDKRIVDSSNAWDRIKKVAEEQGLDVYYINEKGQKRINAMFKSQFDEQFADVKALLLDEKNYVNGITDDYAKQWGLLSQKSEDAFIEYFEKIPDDLQQEVISKMYSAGYSVSEELQKGVSQINPTIQFKADTSNVDTAISNTKTKISGLDWLVNNMFSNTSYILNSVKDYFKADGGIFYNGGWHNIAGYADGGLPPVGQMFVARENGAELVGNINNHTAVMNNDQIVDSVADGVYRAVVNANATTQQSKTSVMIPIQIGTKEIGRVVINDLQKMAKTNGKPIVIGG